MTSENKTDISRVWECVSVGKRERLDRAYTRNADKIASSAGSIEPGRRTPLI